MMITDATVEIEVGGSGAMTAYLARPAAGQHQSAAGQVQPAASPIAGPSPAQASTGVIVAHELFAVSPDIRSVVDDLARAGYLAIAPEFYHRDAPPGHWFQRDDDGRAAAFKLLHRLERDHAVADVAACADWLTAQPGIDRVAVLGFSAGGHLSYLAACRLPVSATAVLYGGWLTSTDIPMSRPTPTLDLTPGISGRLLYLVGEDDALIDAAQRQQIAAALRDAGVDHELVSYPGTPHAFFWPGTPQFDRAARDDAWSRVLGMLAA